MRRDSAVFKSGSVICGQKFSGGTAAWLIATTAADILAGRASPRTVSNRTSCGLVRFPHQWDALVLARREHAVLERKYPSRGSGQPWWKTNAAEDASVPSSAFTSTEGAVDGSAVGAQGGFCTDCGEMNGRGARISTAYVTRYVRCRSTTTRKRRVAGETLVRQSHHFQTHALRKL